MANYVADPAVLLPYLPPKTGLDFYNGKCFVSLIGFMFEETVVKGFRIPFHVNFEEINLRFYVRYNADGIWRRGAVFIKEIVPKRAISIIANLLYKEKYVTLPTKHFYEETADEINTGYHWKFKNEWNKLEVTAEKEGHALQENSKEAFITEHYWGYAKYNSSTTFEYAVGHPQWQIHSVKQFTVCCDFEKLYGKEFAFLNATNPDTVFLAKGSPIFILGKNRIRL